MGTEAEIQPPPDSSVSSLILVGWCEEGHPATKNLLQLSQAALWWLKGIFSKWKRHYD